MIDDDSLTESSRGCQDRSISRPPHSQATSKKGVAYKATGKRRTKQTSAQWRGSKIHVKSHAVTSVRYDLAGILETSCARVNADGFLQFNENCGPPTNLFQWEIVKFLVKSNEQVTITKEARAKRVQHLQFLKSEGGWSQVFQIQADIIYAPTTATDGQTVISKNLQRRVWGTLVNPTAKWLLKPRVRVRRASHTSPDSDRSYIHLWGKGFRPRLLAHELFGHLFLAIKGVPNEHSKNYHSKDPEYNLKAEHKILDTTGKVFVGKVEDFIKHHVEKYVRLTPPARLRRKRGRRP